MGKFYSDEERSVALAALDAHRGHLENTSKYLGIPESTLVYWRDGGAVNRQTAKLRAKKKEELSSRIEALAHNLIDVLPGKVDEMSGKDIAVSLGIAVDKMLILRGQPTSITGNVDITDEDRTERLTALFDALRARRDRQPVAECAN